VAAVLKRILKIPPGKNRPASMGMPMFCGGNIAKTSPCLFYEGTNRHALHFFFAILALTGI
jgi:hypothetical protein